MTLDEEYENQESWRASHDKLTFILCQPTRIVADGGDAGVDADKVDAPEKMIGDINFFIYPFDEEDEEDESGDHALPNTEGGSGASVVGEIDIMIAGHGDRGKGLGKTAVSTFLHYIWSNRSAILKEYAEHSSVSGGSTQPLSLKFLMAKIKATNERSIALFKGLGFKQEGEVNYFGEVKLVMKEFESLAKPPGGYEVVKYRRPVD